MWTSFFIMLIAVILRITVGELSKTYEFLTSWINYFTIAMWVLVAVFVLFVIIHLIKSLRK